jgi:hypothetical protein
MLKDEIEKKKLKKTKKTNNSSKLGLTCQSHNPGHVTWITPYKKNQNKL